jgi:5-methylthioadenosine/S-adenosylhomocysteine deaminase
MSTLLVRDAMILTLDRDGRVIDEGYVLATDNRISAVGQGVYTGPEPDTTIDGRGHIVVPGLVNAHTHSQSSTMAGFGDRLSHPAFMWLTQAYTSRRTPDEIRLSVLLTAYGMLTSGTTAAVDHFPGQRFTRDDMDAVLSAWAETGIRAGLGMRFFDGAFSDIFPAAPLPDALRAQMLGIEMLKPQPLEELARPVESGSLLRCGIAVLRRTRRALRCRHSYASAGDPTPGRAGRGEIRRDHRRASQNPRRALRPLVLRARDLADR